MTPVNWTDHEFARYLRKKDPKWTWNQLNEYTQFICRGEIVAVAIYKNSSPVSRTILIA